MAPRRKPRTNSKNEEIESDADNETSQEKNTKKLRKSESEDETKPMKTRTTRRIRKIESDSEEEEQPKKKRGRKPKKIESESEEEEQPKNKRGRKPKKAESESDDEYTPTETNESIKPAPKKCRRLKSDLIDESFTSEPDDDSKKPPRPKPQRKPRAPKKPKKPKTIDGFTKDDSIKEGINDLMALPIELIQQELIKRNYHTGMVNSMPKWYLVSLLREETDEYRYSYRFRCASKPIFEDDAQTLLKANEHNEEETKNEPNTDFSVDPEEFKDKTTDSFDIYEDAVPRKRFKRRIYDPNQLNKNGMREMDYMALADQGVPYDVLDNLDPNLITAINADFKANKSVSEIIYTHIP
ncbi:hypothetical protein GPJ56_005329 [Histomonas meleagridis]|uniref:uncharacterized protein n=1 Tax=Histomonas meleagridis TaxID=135588 RepID=UPI00355AA733|nr:hypothetical protein GPJ56_005329 [Histomonas meleagridis]KAH0796309.1 hypothetical protein GO595_010202 [Histomonas meleagridis]